MRTFAEYQLYSSETAVYPSDKALEYLALGLAGESGELAGKVSKIIRGDKADISAVRADLIRELGDVLWFLSEMARHLEIKLEDVALRNIAKLRARAVCGKIRGDGDNR